jgi:MFS family permease
MNSERVSARSIEEPAHTTRLTGITKDTLLLALSSLFSDVSTEMLYPVLPVFLTQTLHATGSAVGFVEGLASAAQNIVQGFSGWLSDKLQKRKPLALVGYVASALGKPLMGVATSWPGLLAGRSVDRLGAGFRSAPRDALIAASADDANRGRAFGLEGFGDNLGACLGPLLAWALVVLYAYEIRSIFFLAVIPGIIACLMILLVRERPLAVKPASQPRVPLREFPAAYWKYLAVTALFGLGISSNSFLILQTRSIGASFGTTILVYAGFNLIAALVSYPAGSLSDTFGRRNVLLAGFIVCAIAYLGFARTTNVAVMAAMFFAYGAFQGIFRAVGKAFASDFVPERLRATAVGSYSMTVGLVGLIASVVAGQLWDHVGHAATFYYGALSAAAGIIALVAIIPVRPTPPAVRSLAS